MATVDIIKASASLTDRRHGTVIERKRVAAYCRVSTDTEDQLNSYRSQVAYYTDLINENKDWVMAGIYADEGITGTQVTKREQFQKMIKDCLNGDIDMVITKSISRFARNTLDTLKYVRLLKEKNIPVFFEDEKINTLSMDGELLLVVLSSVAQQEVENISNNVKKGLAMKMSRGEMIGFNRALGFDYDQKTKVISINEKEAEIVRFIFNEYVNGTGASVISHKLEEMGAVTIRGSKSWHTSTILGIIRNEKYKGELIQGKTFTVDPISHRRLDNRGEADKYVIKNHHEPIVSEETWNKAQEILAKRSPSHHNTLVNPDERTKFSRRYTFSCMIQCGFCNSTLTRRTRSKKIIWQCVKSTKYGKRACPQCKGIREDTLESAFVESFNLVMDKNSDVFEEFLERIEKSLNEKAIGSTLAKAKNDLEILETRKKRLLDLKLDEKIELTSFLEKDAELDHAIKNKKEEINRAKNAEKSRKNLHRDIDDMRNYLQKTNHKPLKKFDSKVFESIVEKIIVGGYDNDGNADPLKITFVYKTGFKDKKDGSDFKHSPCHQGGPKPADNAVNDSQLCTDDSQSDLQHCTDGACRDSLSINTFLKKF